MPDAVGSQQPKSLKGVCFPQMGCLALAALPLTKAGFFPWTRAPLSTIRSTHRLPLPTAWRGDGAADRVYEHGVAVSLYAPGLGADPNGGPSVYPHPPRRTDAAPRACGSVGSSPHTELHDLPSATVVGRALQEVWPAHDRRPAPQSGWETRPS